MAATISQPHHLHPQPPSLSSPSYTMHRYHLHHATTIPRADIARIERKQSKPDKTDTRMERIHKSRCMRTTNSYYPNNSSVTIPRRRNKRRAPNIVEPELRTIVEIAPMADNRTIEELLQAPTEGITSTMKFKDVPNDVIKLMMFPYSLEGPLEFGFQNQSFQAPNNQVQQGLPNEFLSYKKSNESMMQNLQIQINKLKGSFSKQEENLRKNLNDDMRSILGSFFQNRASTSGTLLSNTILNPKSEMKAITTRSVVAYEGPSITTNPKKAVERETKETTDKEETNFQGCTSHIQPSVVPISKPDVPKTLPKPNIPYPSRLNDQKLREKDTNQMEKHELPLSIWKKLPLPELTPTRMTLELADRSITHPKGVAEDVFVKVGKFHFLTNFVVVDFEAGPQVPLILGISFLRTGHALIDVYREEITLHINDEAVTFNLNQTTRYSSTYDDMSVNRIASEDYAKEMLGFSNNSLVGNPTPTSKPVIFYFSPSLTRFEGSDFILEEIEAYLNDESISLEIDHVELTKAKSSIEEPPELELKDLRSHLEYAYLKGADKLFVIITKDLKDDEKEALLKVLKSHKRAIAWKITDIKGIDPRFCTHKILMEEDYKPAVQC
nr:reverse transcriptase domain-containing protein [Tanacetum cinerariifolium]